MKMFLYEIEFGDYVSPINLEGLSQKAIEYLKSRNYFKVIDVTDSKGNMYSDGVEHINIGYRIPLKMNRFVKVNPDKLPKYNVLFIQFNLEINTHGEPDTLNFFKGQTDMESLFPMMFNDKKADVNTDFYNYNNIYKFEQSYFINGKDIKDYNFVFFGFMSKQSQIAKIIINYLERNKIPHLKYETFNVEDNKAYGMDVVESLGYPYIPTILSYQLNSKILKETEKFGYPLIVKNINLDRGEGVWKINSREELIDKFDRNKEMMMIQKFIPNTGDFRIIVIKNKVILVVKREQTSSDEFRSNVALGGKAVKTTLPHHILNMCEDISKHLSCDIIGFDILQNSEHTNEFYVMETNISPHFSTFSVVTGINIPEIIVDYILENMKK